MLYRIQADADNTGLIKPGSLQVFDAPLVTDPVTDKIKRGDLHPVDLAADVRQRIADVINAELGGAVKSAERLTAARTKARQQREAESARQQREAEAPKAPGEAVAVLPSRAPRGLNG